MEWMNELFCIWQDKDAYEEDYTYQKIMEFMDKNLTSVQKSELEELLSEDTFKNMLKAFQGGFEVCRDLFLTGSQNKDKR